MAANDVAYSVEQEIDDFSKKTSATRTACDNYAKEHLGGNVIPMAVRGVCSYTLPARPNAESVVQFHLRPFQLKRETANLA